MTTTTTAAATMLALKTAVKDSAKFTGKEVTIVETQAFHVPDNHLIKVTACWRSMSSTDTPCSVTLSITTVDEDNHKDKDEKVHRHRQEQAHRMHAAEGVGQAGGEMSRVLKVRTQRGDITPGLYSFHLRAARVDTTSTGEIVIQAHRTYPTEIRVEDLGVIPSQL
jgi:hypothetical protein